VLPNFATYARATSPLPFWSSHRGMTRNLARLE